MFAIDDKNVYHGETSFEDLLRKQLKINDISSPISTMSRAFRYYKRGFNMSKSYMEKLIIAIQEAPKIELTSNSEEDGESSSGENLD